VSCSNEGCAWRGPGSLAEKHRKECSHVRIQCECGWTGPPEALDAHCETCTVQWREVSERKADRSTSAPQKLGDVKKRIASGVARPKELKSSKEVAVVKEICGPAYRIHRPAAFHLGAVGSKGLPNFQPPVSEDLALEWALQLSLQGDSTATVESSSTDLCAVCLEPAGQLGVTKLPGCGHSFHLPCVAAMVAPKPGASELSCAVCRLPFAWEDVALPEPLEAGGSSDGAAAKAGDTAKERSQSCIEVAEPSLRQVDEDDASDAGVVQPPPGLEYLSAGFKKTEPQKETERSAFRPPPGLETNPDPSPTGQSSPAAAEVTTVPIRPAWRKARQGLAARAQLARAIFHVLDIDGDGRLRARELHFFAQETGFQGSSELWNDEYKFLCQDRGLEVSEGMPEAAFSAFLDDKSEAGCYCSDDELRKVLSRLEARRISCGAAAEDANVMVLAGMAYQ